MERIAHRSLQQRDSEVLPRDVLVCFSKNLLCLIEISRSLSPGKEGIKNRIADHQAVIQGVAGPKPGKLPERLNIRPRDAPG